MTSPQPTIENLPIKYDSDIAPSVLHAKELKVTTADENLKAQNLLKVIKGLKEKVNATFGPICDNAYKTWKLSTDTRSKFLDPIEEADKLIRKKVSTFIDAETEKRREQERKAEADRQRIEDDKKAKAQQKIDEENKRLKALQDAEDEKQRQKDEEIKKTKDKEEKARLQKEEEQRRIDQDAILAEEKRKSEAKTAELAEQKEAIIVQPKIEAPKQELKSQGVSTTTKWKGEVTDPLALMKWVCENPEYVNLFKIEQGKVNTLANLIKGAKQVPGIKFSPETNLNVR